MGIGSFEINRFNVRIIPTIEVPSMITMDAIRFECDPPVMLGSEMRKIAQKANKMMVAITITSNSIDGLKINSSFTGLLMFRNAKKPNMTKMMPIEIKPSGVFLWAKGLTMAIINNVIPLMVAAKLHPNLLMGGRFQSLSTSLFAR